VTSAAPATTAAALDRPLVWTLKRGLPMLVLVFAGMLYLGARFTLGSLPVEVLHTPGHTPACVSYVIGDAAFVGDTLFMPDYGTARADFPGGDAATLFRSIRKILALPSETRVFVGHDYLPKSRDTFVWETTVAEERASNVHVHDGVSEHDFVEMREARDKTLAAPRLILPSLQVNIRAGALPPAEADGNVYLKLPVKWLGAA
jgi:glyoxylase-like metal-dependent hydrolase (beta-lactamase superfamily II)